MSLPASDLTKKPDMRTTMELGAVLPETAEVRDDHLFIGGVDMVELARKEGTALYVFDEADLRHRMEAYREAFRSRYENSDIIYASKAFLNKEVVRIAEAEGLCLDVSGGGELACARAVDFPMERVFVHGNNKTPRELEEAISAGVGRIVLDSRIELARVNEIAGRLGVVQDVYMRITPGVEADTHEYIRTGCEDSKFGFTMREDFAFKCVGDVLAAENVRLVGLHCHIGSQIFALHSFREAAAVMVEFMARIRDTYGHEITELDLGGGLGIAYLAEHQPSSIDDFAEVTCSAVRDLCALHNLPLPRLLVEPQVRGHRRRHVRQYPHGALPRRLRAHHRQQSRATPRGNRHAVRQALRERRRRGHRHAPAEGRPRRHRVRVRHRRLQHDHGQQLQRTAPPGRGVRARRRIARGHSPRDLRGPLPARPVGHRLLVGFIAAGWRNRNKERFTPWQRNQLAKVKAIAESGTHPHAHFRSSLEALGLVVGARPCAARSGSRPSPMNAIYLRSSVRQYTDEPVDIRDIEKLMRAAMAAPSAVNQQPWEFYIARDETTRLALAASSPYGTPAKLAPCVIVACQRTEGLRAPQDASYDMSASVENILIEAANLGLGAVWLGIAPEKDRMAAVDVALGSPGGVTPFALIAVGHPEHKPEPKGPTRYDETRVHWI